MDSFNLLKNNKYIYSYIYLLLAICGAVLTSISNFKFALDYGPGFDIIKFVSLANANPAAESISRDLLISASAFFLWIVNESRKLKMRNMWLVYLGTFIVAFAFSAPLFLFLRERRLIEIEKS